MTSMRIVTGSFAASCCVAACSGTSSVPAGADTGGVTASGGYGDLGGSSASSTAVTPPSGGQATTGGAPGVTGGAATGGRTSGGAATGGNANGGTSTTGGAATGGKATGGAATGGVATGGKASGGASTSAIATGGTRPSTGGNSPTGGKGSGGSAAGGAATGGNAAGGNSGTGGGSAGTCPSGGWAPGKQTISTTWGGVARQYVVYVPKSYTGTSPVPLMLVIHGAHNTPAMAESWSQMDPVSDKNGFIIVYPAGLDCWNAGGILGGCTAADDDLGFLKNVVTEVESHACIDAKRVYATGISNGSMMAQYLGCQAANIFAAVGGVAGPTPQPCSPTRSLSVFYVHGTEDTTVPFSSAQPNVSGWVTRDHCNSTTTQVYSQGPAACVMYQGCSDGNEVEFCTVTGMPHCWPDNCYLGAVDFKASPLMWDFFSQHPMP